MPYYDFKCPECGQLYEIEFSMDAVKECDCMKCNVPLKRIYSRPHMIVKAPLRDQATHLHQNQAVVDVDGRPIKLSFIEHEDRSEMNENSVLKNIQGARMDEKTGRAVVDVVSNVPDPLGMIERSKRKHGSKETKIDVNQPYKTRGKKNA